MLAQWTLAGLFAISMTSVQAQVASSASHPDFSKDIAALMKPLRADFVNNCGLTLFYPALKDFFDEEIEPGCAGAYNKGGHGTVMSIGYSFSPNDPESASKTIGMEINPMRIDDWLTPGEGHDTTFSRSGDGVQLLSKYNYGNNCNNLVRTEINSISGANWHGWIAEEIYGPPGNIRNNDRCKSNTPQYRCIHLVIGNKKMSAEMPMACLLRQETTDLEKGLSYDLFMEMIKSIHFNEK
jgi:hypothetical protein